MYRLYTQIIYTIYTYLYIYMHTPSHTLSYTHTHTLFQEGCVAASEPHSARTRGAGLVRQL